MRTQSLLKWVAGSGLSAAIAIGILFAAPPAQAARMAVPGTINYVEGDVILNGNRIGTHQNGDVALQNGQVLDTAQGKAEVLLSPGSYLRVGSNSEVRMIAAELSDPRVEVVRGEAMVEVDYKPKLAGLDVMERGADTSILKAGLYGFDARDGRVAVIDGKVKVIQDDQSKEFGKGKEVMLNGAPLKTVSFDRKAEDNLYRWSDIRSSYLAEASAESAQTVYVDGGWDVGFGPGWLWNPWFSTWAWLPVDGYYFSPFGYPFYSPRYVAFAPRFYPGAGRGFAGRGFAGRTPVARGFIGRGLSGMRSPGIAAGAHFHGMGGRR